MNQVIGMWGYSMGMLQRSMDYLWTKQQVTANNISNAETPGYKEKYVTFEENFRSRLEAAAGGRDAEKLQLAMNTPIRVNEASNESSRLDENSVNVDAQVAELTRTALQYQYELSSVNSDISRLRTVIKGQ